MKDSRTVGQVQPVLAQNGSSSGRKKTQSSITIEKKSYKPSQYYSGTGFAVQTSKGRDSSSQSGGNMSNEGAVQSSKAMLSSYLKQSQGVS